MPLWSQVAIVTERYDTSRTGANVSETVLNTSNVTPDSFGLLYSYALDGSVQAQPLYVPNVTIPGLGTFNVLFVVTMNDVMYALNADSNSPNGGVLWTKDLRNPGAGITPIPIIDVVGVNNLNIVGNVGIESTPVIDLASNTMYLVARTKEVSGSATNYVARLHAIDITTGSEKFGGPVSISGSVPGTGQGSSGGRLTFDPLIHNQRSSLGLVNGTIVFSWASHEDAHQWHGWVFAYDAQTLQQTSIYCATPNGMNGGIWMAGRAPVVDASGNVYYATGNGDWDGKTNFGDSVIKLSTAGGILSVLDFFTPDTWASLQADDHDLGSSGPLLIPGTDLLVHTGKDSIIRVMHISNMGHELLGNGQIVQNFSTTGGQIRGGMVFWNRTSGSGPTMYVWPDESGLEAFQFNGTKFNTTPLDSSSIIAPNGNSGGVLTLSANDSTPGSGIVWSSMPLNADGDHGTHEGVLRAFDADDLSNELWDSTINSSRDNMGLWPKYSPPTVVNGKVYMASFSNFMNVYGLLPATPDFAMNATPSAQTIAPGASTSYVLSMRAANGFSGTVSLSASGLPAGATATFNPSSIAPGTSSTLTVTTVGSTPATDSTLTITGTSAALSHTSTVTLSVTDFTMKVSPPAQTMVRGGSTSYVLSVGDVNGFGGTVSLSVGGLPAGATGKFSPSSIPAGATSTLTVTAGSSTPASDTTLTITGTSGSLSHAATATLSVTDFTLQASPPAQTVASGGSTTYVLSVGAVNGFSAAVSVSVGGLPAGATGKFSPSSIAPGTNSTLTVNTGATPTGDATVTITGTSGGLSHTATVTLTVTGSGAGAPALSVSPPVLDFGSEILNTQSPSHTVTLSAANGPVSIQGVDVSSSAFVLSNQCAADLAAGAQCSILVSFQPTTLGTLTATMPIQDDTTGSPHVVQLQGQGSHFVFVPGTGSGQVVATGQSATFTVGLQSLAATNETVTVSCSVGPPLSGCTLSQTSFPLSGSLQTFTVTVPTAAHSELLRLRAPIGPLPLRVPQIALWFGVFAAIFLVLASFRPKSLVWPPSLRWRHVLSATLLMALATAMISCAGGTTAGGGGTPQPGGGGGVGTSGGPYAVTITGTSSNAANPPQSVQLTFTTN